MFGVLGLIGIVFAIYRLIKEGLEKPAPKNQRFDWDAYYKDIENGIGAMEQVRKRQRGDYYTTKPENDLVDIERYEHDKRLCGEEFAEYYRKNGAYKFKRK